MNDTGHKGNLGAVYSASKPEDIAEIYDSWADSYDAEMALAGYRHPSICVALMTRHLPSGAGPILDAGAGTGLVGQWLEILGYPHLEALDISEGMLEVARNKKVYKAYHNLPLGSDLPFEDNQYAGIISAGVFTTGHVGSDGFDELIRICKHGGIIVLTIKESLWQDEFEKHLDDLAAGGIISLVDTTEPYVSMPGEEGTLPSRGVVLRVLA